MRTQPSCESHFHAYAIFRQACSCFLDLWPLVRLELRFFKNHLTMFLVGQCGDVQDVKTWYLGVPQELKEVGVNHIQVAHFCVCLPVWI